MMLKDGSVIQWDDKYQLEDLLELPCVTTARMKERERCALVAEHYGYGYDAAIAAEIRKG